MSADARSAPADLAVALAQAGGIRGAGCGMRLSSLRIGLLVVLALLSVHSPLFAQGFVSGAKPRKGTAEISIGGLWTGGQSLPASAAGLTPNPAGGLSSFDLFEVDPTLEQAIGVQGTVGVYLSRRISIEGGVQFSRPRFEVRLTNDFEDALDVTAGTTITSYLFTGSLVYHFAPSARTVPFVAAGAGHVRDVHTGNEVVETGLEYHGTVGIKSWFGKVRKFGLRAEGGVSVRDGGFSYEDEQRVVPMAAVSLLYLF